ncbi:hydrogenase iron-sulfur subunit [Natronomonas sp. EA1]|uniref:hydrogenase iron-sulfur subunit n=1 Tax=Natronomonas sp. EA1 TaxID=3421655 RepID=UPI003EBBBF8F
MNVGAFVCSCGGSCDIDLEATREGVDGVDVVASSELLCQSGLDGMAHVIEEYDIDQVIATATSDSCKRRIRAQTADSGLHPDATAFVDHREGAAWVHEPEAAQSKISRLIDAANVGLEHEAVSRTVSHEAGDHVAVVGDLEFARTIADDADVTLIAEGRDFAGEEIPESVTLQRGRVIGVDGSYAEFHLTVQAGVTDDCIDCMKCVEEGPEGAVTARPVDVAPVADGGWTDCCPTDAIEPGEVTMTVEADQVVHPGSDRATRGGRVGYYTVADAGTVAAVEHHLGGIEKPQFLDIDMEICAAGASSQEGCTECTDACPHDAVGRPTVDSVEFDPVACQNCGACTSACPTGAVQLREPSNERLAREVETLVADDGLDPVVAFVCSETAAERLREYGRRAGAGEDISYPPVLPVRVNCTDTVGEGHLLHALAAGAEGVAIVGCGDACLHSGPDPKAELVERVNRATRDLGLGERVTFLAPERDPSGFTESLTAFADGLDASPIPVGHEAEAFTTHAWVIESVRAIGEHVTPERDVIRGIESVGRVSVTEACNLTPTCSTLCPTDALRRTGEGELQFNHSECVNCGVCEDGCPETAIEVDGGLDLSLLPEANDGEAWTTVHEGEMLECVRCGKPFASKATTEKIQSEVGDLVEGIAPDGNHSIFEYCGDCRPRLLFGGDTR